MRRVEAAGGPLASRVLWVIGAGAGALGLLVVLAAIAAMSPYALPLLLVGWAVVAIAAFRHTIRWHGRGRRRPGALSLLARGDDPAGIRRDRSPRL